MRRIRGWGLRRIGIAACVGGIVVLGEREGLLDAGFSGSFRVRLTVASGGSTMAPVPTPAMTSATARPRRSSNHVDTARE